MFLKSQSLQKVTIVLTYSKATTYLVNFNYCQNKVFTFAMNDLFNIYRSKVKFYKLNQQNNKQN